MILTTLHDRKKVIKDIVTAYTAFSSLKWWQTFFNTSGYKKCLRDIRITYQKLLATKNQFTELENYFYCEQIMVGGMLYAYVMLISRRR